jgi:hypothetical protein
MPFIRDQADVVKNHDIRIGTQVFEMPQLKTCIPEIEGKQFQHMKQWNDEKQQI